MSHKKLLKYLRENKPSASYRRDLFSDKDAAKWIEGAIMFLEECSAFYIDGGISSLQEEEIFASAKAMKEVGVFKLPATLTYIEISFEIKVAGTNKTIPARLAVMASGDSIRGAFLRESHWPKNEWVALPLEAPIDPPLSILAHNIPKGSDGLLHASRQLARSITSALIVLLCTKGIEVERVGPKRCNLTSREISENGYTIVHIKRAIAKQHLGGTVDERKRVRLHMRRGHVRHQHYGPRNCHERIIWIAPVLVGYEEEGRVEHDYLVEE